MYNYNYYEAVKADVLDYIEDEIDFSEFETMDALEDYLNDHLWTCDSVTGNGSGSYTFNTYRAEEYLCHNWELLAEALREFDCDVTVLENGAEYCDVTIRCYLLGQCIAEAMEEIEEDFDAAHEEEEEEEE